MPAPIHAFPWTDQSGDWPLHHPGMSLRDYFAAAALTGLLAAETESLNYPSRAHAAEDAYATADAMMARRAVPPKIEGGTDD